MSAIEIHISAERLLRRHGRDAWARTVTQAEASAAIGDWDQVGVWRRIGGAVRALERRVDLDAGATQFPTARNTNAGMESFA